MADGMDFGGLVQKARENFLAGYWEKEKEHYSTTMRELAIELQKALDSDMEFFEVVSVARLALQFMIDETEYALRKGGFRGLYNVHELGARQEADDG